jgi:peptide/nickel transport system substrate-binding protein
VLRDRRLGWRLIAATGALAMVATACGGNGDDGTTDDDGTATETGDDGEAAAPEGDPDNYCEGGGEAQLVWAHEQEPPDLHLDDPNNNLSITSWIQQPMLEGLHAVTADTTFVPELLEDEIEIVENDDDTVTLNHTLREGLTWSDGTPLTSEDVQHTFELIMDEEFLIGSRQGYDQIDPDSWELTSDTEFSYTTTPFSGYQSLFPRIYPAHVLTDAATANEALVEWDADGEPIPSSGPMLFEEWNRGVSLTMTRNDDYHGAHPDHPDVTNNGVACVSGVQINFVADTVAQINALRAGEADLIFTQPQVAFGERLATDEAFTIASEAGPTFEHWSLNLFNEHLSDINVREALAYAMDKSAVMEALYTPLFDDVLPAEGLGNTYWMSNQPTYVDNAGDEGYGQGDFESAQALLEESGYELNSDDVYEHPERGPLTLRVGTTGGNELRELQIQILQAQLAEAGFDIQVDNVAGGAYFAERPFAPDATECSMTQGESGDCGIWDIAQFAWVGGPWPGGQNVAYETEGGNNPHGYANEEFMAKAEECNQTLDQDALADCFNELDRFVTTRDNEDGVIILPITQKPNYYAYSNERLDQGAVAVDANDAGPIVNIVDFLPVS